MKILLINTVYFKINGISVVVLNEHEKLSDKGIKVDIVANGAMDVEFKKSLEKKNGKTFILSDRKKNLQVYMKELINILRKGNYDIVHVHGNSSTMIFEILANKIAKSAAKVLVHNHNTNVNSNSINKLLYPFFMKNLDRALACGSEAGKSLYKNENFEIINNGIDLQSYLFSNEERKKHRESLDISENTKVVGHIGSFNRQKNHGFLIDIFIDYQKEVTDSVLLLIGEGESKTDIFNKIKSLNIEDKVIYINKTNEISKYLHVMDIFILPSLHEGLPLVGIEAQASGLSCIISDAVDETVKHSENLFFLPVTVGVEIWKEKLLSISPIGIKREKLSKENITELKVAGFDINDSIEKLINIYYEVLKGDKRRK